MLINNLCPAGDDPEPCRDLHWLVAVFHSLHPIPSAADSIWSYDAAHCNVMICPLMLTHEHRHMQLPSVEFHQDTTLSRGVYRERVSRVADILSVTMHVAACQCRSFICHHCYGCFAYASARASDVSTFHIRSHLQTHSLHESGSMHEQLSHCFTIGAVV